MGDVIPNPYDSSYPKRSHGISNTYIRDGVYKFMGCSILSVNMSLGFNGTASSLSITLVEDTEKGDLFIEPDIPSLWAFSLPKGGVGVDIFVSDGFNFNQQDFAGANVPFYMSGICTSWSRVASDAGGRTLQVTLSDPREILNGVHCLLGGFALSQNIGVGTPRYIGVDNVIDVFGYFDYGMDSERNEYGMPWNKIVEALTDTRVRLYDMYFEFTFSGAAFTDAPDFYRIEEESIDLIGLCQKVASDAGSDFVVFTRKVANDVAVVEFYAIDRTSYNELTRTEVLGFIAARDSIVENARIGQEFRNEPTSAIIVGGPRNANYLALPSQYVQSMHLTNNKEDYNAFPADIKVRLFGGSTQIYKDNGDGQPLVTVDKTYSVETGAIFPFWGFTPDDHAYPLIEPFISLDHLVFTKRTSRFGQLYKRIPFIKIGVKNFTVRTKQHSDVFLEGDGDSDERPFAYIEDIRHIETESVHLDGYLKGLPLNTEVLRAAILSNNMYSFYRIYEIHYPEIAQKLGVPSFQDKDMSDVIDTALSKNQIPDLKNFDIATKMFDWSYLEETKYASELDAINEDKKKRIGKNTHAEMLAAWKFGIGQTGNLMVKFLHIIYDHIKQYAHEHMGRRWMVCLPRSEIMQRIWAGLPVPTRPEKPEIEYQVDSAGFWEEVPAELDGIAYTRYGTPTPSSEEDQIRRKFMAEDGRFYPMVIMQHKPSGNINFNANGKNEAMFQDLPVSDFRPNRIASGNPSRVFIACGVNQLAKRPDLAIVETSTPVFFDPTDSREMYQYEQDLTDDEKLATKSGLIKFFWYYFKANRKNGNHFRDSIKKCADANGINYYIYASSVFRKWAENLSDLYSKQFMFSHSTEPVMDLEGITIPLTSRWTTYGPWYSPYNNSKGSVQVMVDTSLVPWNFTTPSGVDGNFVDDGRTAMERLDDAGQERLARSIANTEYLDSATITVAGFPEIGLGQTLGPNNNLTSISVDFGIGGVRSTYNFATYSARPGTYRKSDYDNVSRSRIDNRERLPEVENLNLAHNVGLNGTNFFRNGRF